MNLYENDWLSAEKSAIEKRILEESRLSYSKMKDIELLHKIWDENELFSPVPERTSLIIDNTNISAENTAKMIIEHFKLQ